MTKNFLLFILLIAVTTSVNAQWTNLNPPDSNYENYLSIGVSQQGKNIAMSCTSLNRVTFEITNPYMISNDYGATWNVRPGKSSQFDYLFWEGDVLYVKSVLPGGIRLLSSNDFGATFTLIDSAFESNSPSIISAPNGNWYHNLAGNIYESTNKGRTWVMTSVSDVNFMDYTIADNGNIVATYSKGVGYSTDSGKNWSLASFSTTDTWTESANSISKAADGSLIYMGKSRTRMYKSVDHGVTWQLLAAVPPVNTIKLLHSGNDIIAMTTTGATYKCSDETSFIELTPAVTGILINGNAMAKAGNYVFACGNSGAYRYGSGNTTGVKEAMIMNTSVYPNPTARYLTVDTKDLVVQFKIYNVIGEQVDGGEFLSSTIDVNELVNGIYFLHLINSDESSVIVRFVKH